MRKIASLLLLSAVAVFAQKLSFDVASIKPAPPINPQSVLAGGKLHVGMQVDASRVDIGYMSLADLIPMAFKLKGYQVQGPDWMNQQRFDILATLPDGAKPDQVPQMMQTLLAERFGLKFHMDSKDQNVYALVVNKGGVKMQEAAPEEPAKPAEGADAPKPQGMAIQVNGGQVQMQQGGNGTVVVRASGGGMNQQGMGGVKMTMGQGGQMQMELKTTMGAFVDVLSRFVDKPVMDMTELKGTYEAKLELTMADMLAVARASGANIPPGAAAALTGGAPGAGANPAGAALDPGSGASIFESVQKLGLKLEPRKLPMDLMVIDKLEKNPTDN